MNEEVVEWLDSRKLDPLTVNEAFSLRRGQKNQRLAIRYPTPIGVDRARFIDGEHPKYKWWKSGGKTHWYGLPQAIELLDKAPDAPIYVVNGEPSVWSAWQSGVAAVCTCGGEGSIPSDADLKTLIQCGRPIKIVFDADPSGDRGSIVLAQAFMELGAGDQIQVRRWQEFIDNHPALEDRPDKDIAGFDVDDLHQIVGDAGLSSALLDLEIVVVERADKPLPRNMSHWHIASVVLTRIQYQNGPDMVWSDGGFWRYSDAKGIWQDIADLDIDAEVGSLDGTTIVDGEKPKTFTVRSSVMDSIRKCAIVQAAKPGFFDDSPEGVQFQNGWLSSGSATLSPSSPDSRQQVSMPCNYDPEAQCPMWLKTLEVIFGCDMDAVEKVSLLQEFAGAIIFGITGRVLFMLGGGANGKSTVTDILSALVPESSRCAVTPSKLSQGHQAEYWVARLAGKRLNIDADISARELLESSEFKKSVTGDILTGRHPAGKPFDFKPKILHLFSANELPPTRDHSHGFWRRVIALEFTRRLDEDPKVVVIPDLSKKILASELAGVVAWAIRGGQRLISKGGSKGFTIPESSIGTMDRWKLESDQVAMFIDQACSLDTEHWTPAKQLYKDYRVWAKDSGHGPMSRTSFGKRLGQLGFDEDAGNKKRSNGFKYRIAVLTGSGGDMIF